MVRGKGQLVSHRHVKLAGLADVVVEEQQFLRALRIPRHEEAFQALTHAMERAPWSSRGRASEEEIAVAEMRKRSPQACQLQGFA